MTYSFDVFDTCLIRACGMPHFVSNLLAERILGKDASESELNDYPHNLCNFVLSSVIIFIISTLLSYITFKLLY